MAAFIFVLLLVCRVPNALALAMFGGVMDVLPYIGPLLTIAPAVFAAYGNGPAIAVVVFAALLLYEELESRFLVPLVYGRALRLPSAVVLFSLIVGAVLGGIIGALLALPLAAAIVMLIDQLRVDLPGETEQPRDVDTRRKDERQEREYERRTDRKPAAKAAAIAVEIAMERKQEEDHPKPAE
jgi:predicted PurR-regulated permease PerM